MERYNCPNCGAPIQEDKCQYCGTVIHDFSALKLHQENFIKLRIGDKIITFRALFQSMQVDYPPSEGLYADDKLVFSLDTPPCVHMDFEIMRDERGVYTETIRKEETENG